MSDLTFFFIALKRFFSRNTRSPCRQHRTSLTRMPDKTPAASNETKQAREMKEPGTAKSMTWWTINHLAARHISCECMEVPESPECERAWGLGSVGDNQIVKREMLLEMSESFLVACCA